MPDSVVTAAIAAGSALLGSVIGVAGQIGNARYQEWREKKKDEPRRELLRAMLKDERFQWRKLATLSHVIGTDPEATKRLLLEVDARASENGQDIWGLVSRNPIKKIPE